MNVKIKLVDWSTWISDVYRASKFDLTVIGHTGKLDPDGTLADYGTEKRYVKLRVSSNGMRIIDKKGIDEVLKDVRAAGHKV